MSASRSGQRSGRSSQRRQAVTIGEIAETALRILDKEGLEALTMRRLAGEMGVQPMTLYRYLPDKEAILAVVADRLWSRLQEIPPAETWRGRVRGAWLAMHHLMQQYPHATPIIARAGSYSATAAAATARMLEILRDAGFPPDLASDLMHAAGATVVGFAFAMSWQRLEREGRRPQVPAGKVVSLPGDLEQYVREAAPWHTGQFERALDFLLDGFERKVAEAQLAPSSSAR